MRLGREHHIIAEPAAPPPAVDGTPIPRDGTALAHGARIVPIPGGDLRLRFFVTDELVRDNEDRLITLMEIARTITSAKRLDEVLPRVLQGAVRFSGAQRGYLFLKDRSQSRRGCRPDRAGN